MGIIYCLSIHTIRIRLLNLFPVYVLQVILAASVVSKSVKGKLVYYCPFMKSKYILKFLVPLYAFLYHFFYLAYPLFQLQRHPHRLFLYDTIYTEINLCFLPIMNGIHSCTRRNQNNKYLLLTTLSLSPIAANNKKNN